MNQHCRQWHFTGISCSQKNGHQHGSSTGAMAPDLTQTPVSHQQNPCSRQNHLPTHGNLPGRDQAQVGSPCPVPVLSTRRKRSAGTEGRRKRKENAQT